MPTTVTPTPFRCKHATYLKNNRHAIGDLSQSKNKKEEQDNLNAHIVPSHAPLCIHVYMCTLDEQHSERKVRICVKTKVDIYIHIDGNS